MYSVYAIFNSKHNKIYIGQSQNLDNRLKLHQQKIFKNSYTARFSGDWRLMYRENCGTRKEAMDRERQLKSYQGRMFIKKTLENNK